ncbi:phage tail tube protein [Dyella lutea]|uniref:Phage tail tube protein n=1 Tax=Dyella lutea TaxID=2950441 RepID=A0ABT1FGS9_9GAMM|nr:phage tail tube protein [Dyella lutea]MCP1375392.1 phage tail tube protein [Dyella lutea]
MAKMFGKATVKVDGQTLLTDDASKLMTGGVKRNVVKGNEVHGYAEEAVEASVEMNVFINADTDLDAINNMADVTMMFQCDTGQTYVLPHAWLESPVEPGAATSGGKTPLKFVAAKAEPV